MEKVKINNLGDLTKYFYESDYKERFKGEVLELGYRIHKLEVLLDMTPEDRGFSFNCPRHLLEAQLETMRALAHVYEIRAHLEEVEIPEVDYE